MKSNSNRPNKLLVLTLAVTLLAFLGGCAATNTMISKRNLDVQTKMSDTIFLEPSEPSKQTVYIQVRNTSDKDIQIKEAIASAITSHGYKVVRSPKRANYMLQASILQVGKMDPSAAKAALASGYGGALEGAAIGAMAAAASNNRSSGGYAGFGLLGAIAGTVANATVKDVTYTMITDLQISERAKGGVVINQQTNTSMSQGSSTHVTQKSSSRSKWRRYRTRIVSTANKANLEFAEAKPELERGLTRSISGIF